MRLLVALLTWIMLTTISCSSAKYLSPEALPSFAYFEPISYIYTISKKEGENLNDSLSIINRDLLDDGMSKYAAQRIYIESDSLHYATLGSIESMVTSLQTGNHPYSIKVPSVLKESLSAASGDFTIGVLSDGFIVDKKKHRNAVIWSSVIAVASLGTAVNIPARHSNYLYVLVFDNAKQSLANYKVVPMDYKDPTDPKDMLKQVKTLVKKLSKDHTKLRLLP